MPTFTDRRWEGSSKEWDEGTANRVEGGSRENGCPEGHRWRRDWPTMSDATDPVRQALRSGIMDVNVTTAVSVEWWS